MTPQEQANRELAGKFWHYTATGDHPKLLDLLADDCVFKIGVGHSETVVPYHGTFSGKTEIAGYLSKARAGRARLDCKHVSLVPGEATLPFEKGDNPSGLMVHGNTVVGMGTIHDRFVADRSHMHDSDFMLVLRMNEQQNKVQFFQMFFDTAAVAFAWLNKKA